MSQLERRWAQTAWRYFENNLQPETGLVNTVDRHPSTTMWDTGSYLMALISARRLELISHQTFDERISQALASLSRLELFAGRLPNKSYNAKTLAMTKYDNTPSEGGIGWSAIDLGRLLVPLHIILLHCPDHAAAVQKILHRWEWRAAALEGQLFGAVVKDGETQVVQEGRLGYEQYAARAFSLLGFDMSIAGNAAAFLNIEPQYNIDVPVDSRQEANNYVLSEPYLLDGLEFGGGKLSGEFAWRVYQVQEARFKKTGVLTAVSEDHLDQPPYFVYNTVFVNGEFWKAVTDDGTDAEPFKTLSTKAAFGWHALYRTDYTAQLLNAVNGLYDYDRGWYAGQYEKDGKLNQAITANTNGVVLESLAVMQFGRIAAWNYQQL